MSHYEPSWLRGLRLVHQSFGPRVQKIPPFESKSGFKLKQKSPYRRFNSFYCREVQVELNSRIHEKRKVQKKRKHAFECVHNKQN